jgi:hypothetical protein
VTWGEFKAAVEAAGVKDDTPIFYIVWDALFDSIDVTFGKDGSVKVEGDFKK